MTRSAVLVVVKGVPADKRKSVACALVGHSRMLEKPCFGYWSCGRCGDQIGDSLGGAFSCKDAVIRHHGCPTCKTNAKALGWKDRLLMPPARVWLAPKPAAREKGGAL